MNKNVVVSNPFGATVAQQDDKRGMTWSTSYRNVSYPMQGNRTGTVENVSMAKFVKLRPVGAVERSMRSSAVDSLGAVFVGSLFIGFFQLAGTCAALLALLFVVHSMFGDRWTEDEDTAILVPLENRRVIYHAQKHKWLYSAVVAPENIPLLAATLDKNPATAKELVKDKEFLKLFGQSSEQKNANILLRICQQAARAEQSEVITDVLFDVVVREYHLDFLHAELREVVKKLREVEETLKKAGDAMEETNLLTKQASGMVVDNDTAASQLRNDLDIRTNSYLEGLRLDVQARRQTNVELTQAVDTSRALTN